MMKKYNFSYGICRRRLVLYLGFLPVIVVSIHQLLSFVLAEKAGYAIAVNYSYQFNDWFCGLSNMDNSVMQRTRDLPVEWLVVQVCYLIFISGYVFEDFHFRSENIIRFGSFNRWWRLKLNWFFLMTLIFYSLFAFLFFIVNFIERKIPVNENNIILCDTDKTGLTTEIVLTSFFVILLSLMIGMLQICLELVMSANWSMIINIGLLISGCFSDLEYLPVKFAMTNQNTAVCGNSVMACTVILLESLIIYLEIRLGKRICNNEFKKNSIDI